MEQGTIAIYLRNIIYTIYSHLQFIACYNCFMVFDMILATYKTGICSVLSKSNIKSHLSTLRSLRQAQVRPVCEVSHRFLHQSATWRPWIPGTLEGRSHGWWKCLVMFFTLSCKLDNLQNQSKSSITKMDVSHCLIAEILHHLRCWSPREKSWIRTSTRS